MDGSILTMPPQRIAELWRRSRSCLSITVVAVALTKGENYSSKNINKNSNKIHVATNTNRMMMIPNRHVFCRWRFNVQMIPTPPRYYQQHQQKKCIQQPAHSSSSNIDNANIHALALNFWNQPQLNPKQQQQILRRKNEDNRNL